MRDINRSVSRQSLSPLRVTQEQLELGYHRLKLQRQIAGMRETGLTWEVVSGPERKMKVRGRVYTVKEAEKLFNTMTKMKD